MIAWLQTVRRGLAEIPGGAPLLERLPLVVGCALLVPLVAAGAHVAADARYVSEARVLLKLGREFMSPPGPSGGASSMYRLNEAINSEIEILTSHELAREVVAALGPVVVAPKLEGEDLEPGIAVAKASRHFLDSLSVAGIAESSVIRIAYAATEATTAQRALERLLESFQRRHLGIFGDDGLELAREVHRQAGAALAAAEERRSAYWREHGLFDPAEERALLLRRREELEGRRRTLEAERGALGVPSTSGEPPVADGDPGSSLEGQLLTLRAEETRLLNNYHETSLAVRTVRTQIFALENVMERQRASRREAIDGELAALVEDAASVDRSLVDLRRHDGAVREFEREVATAEAQRAAALAELRGAEAEARLDAQQVTSVRVIDAPILPIAPMGVSLFAKLALGGIAGLLLGVSLVLILHLQAEGREPAAR